MPEAHDRQLIRTMTANRRMWSDGSLRWLAIAAAVSLTIVLLDATSKQFIERKLGPASDRHSIPIAGEFIELSFGRNSGIAFGLLSESSSVAEILALAVIVPLTFVLMVLAMRGLVWAIAAGLVFGGAAGNLIDRIDDRMVTDFISIGRWPSFNLADAAVTTGAVLLIASSVFSHNAGETKVDPSE